jgi:hypothetical protein
VRDQALYGKGWEELFHQPASLPLAKAKVDHSEWKAEIESRFATLHAQQRGEGHDLTERQARALAGEWYRWFVGQHEENPGDPDGWLACQWAVTDEIEAAVGGDRREIGLGAPEVRRKIRPIIADKAETAQFLACKGEVLTPAAMTLFLDRVLSEFLTATSRLNRMAAVDYSSDPHVPTLPEYCKTMPVPLGAGKTCLELFEAYIKAAKPAPSTVNRWRVIFTTLDEHLDGRDIDTFAADDAQRWAGSLVSPTSEADVQ